jgi:large subunit ribosomal protein L25
MDQKIFNAVERITRGKGPVGRLRREGQIPAVIYGRAGKAVSVSLDEKEAIKTLKMISESTIVKVKVGGGGEYDAFVKDTQIDYLSGKFLHVDFYEVEKDRMLRARVPLKMVGTPIGVREGGVFEHSVHEIEVECLPADLPERLSVDVSNLSVNQSIHVRDLSIPGKVKVHTSPDQVVAAVKYAKEEKVEAVAEAVEEVVAEGAEPAAEGEATTDKKAAPEKKEK